MACYEVSCVKQKLGKWKLYPKSRKLVTKYNEGWSDNLVDSVKMNGYYFILRKL